MNYLRNKVKVTLRSVHGTAFKEEKTRIESPWWMAFWGNENYSCENKCIFYRGTWQGCWPLRYSHRKCKTELTQVKEWTQKIQGKEWFSKNLSCMLQILFYSKMELYLCAFLIIDTSHFKFFSFIYQQPFKNKNEIVKL